MALESGRRLERECLRVESNLPARRQEGEVGIWRCPNERCARSQSHQMMMTLTRQRWQPFGNEVTLPQLTSRVKLRDQQPGGRARRHFWKFNLFELAARVENTLTCWPSLSLAIELAKRVVLPSVGVARNKRQRRTNNNQTLARATCPSCRLTCWGRADEEEYDDYYYYHYLRKRHSNHRPISLFASGPLPSKSRQAWRSSGAFNDPP